MSLKYKDLTIPDEMLPINYSKAPDSRFTHWMTLSKDIIFSMPSSHITSPRGERKKLSVNYNLQMEVQAENVCIEMGKKL